MKKGKFKKFIRRIEFIRDLFLKFGYNFMSVLGFLFGALALIYINSTDEGFNTSIPQIAVVIFVWWVLLAVLLVFIIVLLKTVYKNKKNWTKGKFETSEEAELLRL